jgi:uncharacterized protein YbjT (DUF2867 family)
MTTVWLAGGSGLVGGELLQLVLADDSFTRIVSAGRRTLPIEHPKLVQATVDFSRPTSFTPFEAPDLAFSCLGTTMKKAGSREAFRAVDYDAVLAFANAARAKGARVFIHVSSLGANARSRNFYYSVKGEIEAALEKVGFDSLYALRPSMLDGDRADRRPLERFALAGMRALGPVLGKYRPTPILAVARTMIAKAKERTPGSHLIEANAIVEVGGSTVVAAEAEAAH